MKIYIGTYTSLGGPGVAVCGWTDGRLILLSTAREVDNPIWLTLSPDGQTLYAAGFLPGTPDGAVAAWRVTDAGLVFGSMQPSCGVEPCHLALSPDARFLYAANYMTGSVSVHAVDGASVGPCIQLAERHGSGPRADRQEAAHTHQCTFRPGTNELFVCDLGSDRVAVYDQDPATGLLTAKDELVMPAGMGPRHLAFDGADRFYITGELDNIVRRVTLTDGAWIIDDELSALPEGWTGFNTTAALRLHDGALWVSNRGHDSLCRIALDAQGRMTDRTWTPTGGRIPRDFAFVPGGVLFAHQEQGGVIADNGAALAIAGAVCVCAEA